MFAERRHEGVSSIRQEYWLLLLVNNAYGNLQYIRPSVVHKNVAGLYTKEVCLGPVFVHFR